MISRRLRESLDSSICIRDIFEEGKKLAAIYGAENIFNFTIGNPSVEPPAAVNEALKEIIDTEKPLALHGYPANVGHPEVRSHIANYLNGKYDCNYTEQGIIMTSGAAAAIVVIANTLLDDGDEVVTFAPYFWEYKSYVETMYGKLVPALCNMETLQPDPETFEAALSPRTRFVLINTPNNPTGVVYSEETIKKMAAIMEAKQKEYGTEIFLISDEPYRELVYDGAEVPYLTKYYDNTIVGYSYSKSLSLPGERIGYLVIPDEVADSEDMLSAANVANRILGFVNAPTLQQKIVKACLNEKTDISYYDRNREALYNGLKECGFDCIKPEGAFYLFVKSPVENEKEFCEAGKKYNILMVPGSSFACPGYVRLAYCVSYDDCKFTSEIC